MRLAEFLKAHDLTATAFAERIGRSTATVSRLARGIQRPDWSTIEAIDTATGGQVTANDFRSMDAPPAATPEAAA